MALPAVIAHADWSVSRRKRQVATARLAATGAGYVVTSLEPAPDGGGPAGDLLQWLAALAAPGQALAGFDFPVGLPRRYAEAAGIPAFPGFLDVLGSPPWHEFAVVARQPGEITLHRPFYPAAAGGTRREHLYRGLGLSAQEVRRRCDAGDAESLFWTLGARQAGKGALAGWRMLAAARRRLPPAAFWPFDGALPALLNGGGATVVAEAYPREFYQYVRPAGRRRFSKRRLADRLAWMPGVLGWADSLGVTWSGDVRRRVEEGLSSGPYGEDEFDAVIGLLGMIAVVTGAIPSGEPADDAAVTAAEGWILGRSVTGLAGTVAFW